MTEKPPYILAIETSCDDTSVALVNSCGFVKGLKRAHQNNRHQYFGGIVPEVASRAHTEVLIPMIEDLFLDTGVATSDIEGIAVTNRPGLIGSLLVGVVTAKTLALAWNKPIIGVNHLFGHIAANMLWDENIRPPHLFSQDSYPRLPWLVLLVSGGHTVLYWVEDCYQIFILGQTRDDAAGEAFDKFGKLLGLPFPGGPQVDYLARGWSGRLDSHKKSPFHIGEMPGYDFSFSGIKAAAERLIKGRSWWSDEEKMELAFYYQKAIVDSLLTKLKKASNELRPPSVMVTGGVSANSYFRDELNKLGGYLNTSILIPPLCYTTDNAAMVGLAGWWHWDKRTWVSQDSDAVRAFASSLADDFLSKHQSG
ncbi:MAG: tRNA (adenosine(37)-N6)-threonylcarbamoyltransferase complex transferase subunit TsaD [Bdellovibrionaceae bacterium]|nr:tRNA (adenosine(37)-N6)-threonylcarbamoyltransferase complex transferase subunit TsaD [Pseudobdellovibrionaceae bacterium]MDW8189818.1 tRNA (adenosine(37)-N6)-threonylcarbamoyltransferase complex transferase subunit TsaD [Pseudobdellovibrionaceae bacterium]